MWVLLFIFTALNVGESWLVALEMALSEEIELYTVFMLRQRQEKDRLFKTYFLSKIWSFYKT